MHSIQILPRIQAERNPALVGDHDHLPPGAIQLRDRIFHARQQFELLPTGHELAVRRIAVQDAVPI